MTVSKKIASLHSRPPKRSGGFSLIEVLIAIAVVGIGLLALVAVLVTGTRSNQHGQDLSRATYYARKIMESIRQDGLAFQGAIPPAASSGLNDAPGVFRPIADPTPLALAGIRVPQLDADGNAVLDASNNPVMVASDDKFQRNIRIRRASNKATDYNFDLLILEVTVRWQGGKQGDGMRRVKLTSLLKRGT